jgi:hypothetical protein
MADIVDRTSVSYPLLCNRRSFHAGKAFTALSRVGSRAGRGSLLTANGMPRYVTGNSTNGQGNLSLDTNNWSSVQRTGEIWHLPRLQVKHKASWNRSKMAHVIYRSPRVRLRNNMMSSA